MPAGEVTAADQVPDHHRPAGFGGRRGGGPGEGLGIGKEL